jgi:hypothetical protein
MVILLSVVERQAPELWGTGPMAAEVTLQLLLVG